MLKRIGIIGAGNVGAALVIQAAALDLADEVVVAARDQGKAEAAILDAGSAYPEAASKFVASTGLQGSFDVVVVTAGLQPHGDISAEELLKANLQIAQEAVSGVDFQIMVVIGTPVDRLAEALTQLPQFKGKQVIGFGGQLDTDRVKYALLEHGHSPSGEVHVIGEHGPRTIPVYGGEAEYETIRQDATTVLKRIGMAGKARNLATGVQLARLLQALAGQEQVLCVSAPDQDNGGLSLTWPYVVNQTGLAKKVEIPNIGPQATKLWQELLALRQQEIKPNK